MTTGSRAPQVDGYSKISFWREKNIGIISLLSPGTFTFNTISELIKSLSIAAVDDNVRSILITGSNYSFSRGLDIPSGYLYADLRNYYESIKGLILFMISLDKPIFASINGSAINNGISFALLADEVFVSDNTKLTFDQNEPLIFLYSITAPKRLKLENNKISINGINVDKDEMMRESLEISETIAQIPYQRDRRYRFNGFESILIQEELDFLDFYLWCEGKKR
ncbi:MAG: enoyl-CoA hydratase/isomerase family protein [Thermoplasmata archaeon]